MPGIHLNVLSQPSHLLTGGRYVNLGVKGINAPGTQIVGIISRDSTEIIKITCRAGCEIFVIAGYRHGSIFMPAPGGMIAGGKFFIRALQIHIISEDKHSAGDLIQ
jgi:hypothetical protein